MTQISGWAQRAGRVGQSVAGVSIMAAAVLVGTHAIPKIAPVAVPAVQAQSVAPPSAQPYAGWETRPIKALSPERVADLLAGRGASYALAAELNHYPGPKHVLDLSVPLQLRPEQEQIARDLFVRMEHEALQLGSQLVDLEAELDAAFSSGTITPASLEKITADIGTVESQLRSVHLKTHLVMREVLTEEQVIQYDQLRGYMAEAPAEPASDQHTQSTHSSHATQRGHAGH